VPRLKSGDAAVRRERNRCGLRSRPTKPWARPSSLEAVDSVVSA